MSLSQALNQFAQNLGRYREVFRSQVIERCRRREESVEEALMEMYMAGVSTRRVDDISQLLWGDGSARE